MENMEKDGESARERGADALSAAPPLPDLDQRPVVVEIKDLTKLYEGKRALDHLNLEIRQGDIFGFIGPNGAGKTTTIRILSALLLPTSGKAFIDGIDVVASPRRIKEIVGYMPDSFGVYENMTLHEYLDFFGAAYRIPRPERGRVIADVLALTDLGSKRNDQISVFSRGMKQRACLAKTLIHNPRVLLLDEPASGLDPRARIELRELLKELQRMGKTIVVSSHILTELSTICNTVGIIEAGKLLAAGPVGDIVKSVRGTRRFTLDLLEREDASRAVELLQKQPAVKGAEVAGASIQLALEASDVEIASLIEGVVAERIRFTSFREETVDLETAFMSLTQGKLA